MVWLGVVSVRVVFGVRFGLVRFIFRVGEFR